MAQKIIFIGDDFVDVAEGIPTDDQSYLHWLEILSSQVPFQCIFLGHCGAKTQDILNEVDNDITTYNPDLVVVSCGLNDIKANVKASTAANNVKKIFNKIYKKKKLGLLLLYPMEGTDPSKLETKEQRYSDFIQACLELQKSYGYNCIANLIGIGLGVTGRLVQTSYDQDQMLTAKGHNYIAGVVTGFILEILQPPQNSIKPGVGITSKIYADRLNRSPVCVNMGSASAPDWKEIWFNAKSLSAITVWPKGRY